MGRVPILSFHHSVSQACIWRTSKLKTGRGDWQAYTQSYLQAISNNYILMDLKEKSSNNSSLKQSSYDFINSPNRNFPYYFETLNSLKEIYEQMIVRYVKMEYEESVARNKTMT